MGASGKPDRAAAADAVEPQGVSSKASIPSALLPCPFCGADWLALTVGQNERGCTWIACEICEAEGPAREPDDGETVGDLWNTRA